MALESNPAHTPFSSGVAGLAYNEAAFGHFLAIERRRAERSSGSLLLVLVSVQSQPGRNDLINPQAAAELFRRLGSAVREVDFVGWFKEHRVAAAVLTQPAMTAVDTTTRVVARVRKALDGQTHAADRSIRVRVVPLTGRGVLKASGVKQA